MNVMSDIYAWWARNYWIDAVIMLIATIAVLGPEIKREIRERRTQRGSGGD